MRNAVCGQRGEHHSQMGGFLSMIQTEVLGEGPRDPGGDAPRSPREALGPRFLRGGSDGGRGSRWALAREAGPFGDLIIEGTTAGPAPSSAKRVKGTLGGEDPEPTRTSCLRRPSPGHAEPGARSYERGDPGVRCLHAVCRAETSEAGGRGTGAVAWASGVLPGRGGASRDPRLAGSSRRVPMGAHSGAGVRGEVEGERGLPGRGTGGRDEHRGRAPPEAQG